MWVGAPNEFLQLDLPQVEGTEVSGGGTCLDAPPARCPTVGMTCLAVCLSCHIGTVSYSSTANANNTFPGMKPKALYPETT